MRPTHAPMLLALLALSAGHAHAAIIYVRPTPGGNNTGTSWQNAFTGRLALQSALAVAAPGDEIWLAQGEYAPAAPAGNPAATFSIPDAVSLYGGFTGVEVARNQRDPLAHPTILTGDLDNDDPDPPFNTRNSDHIVTITGAGSATVIDGVTIRYGGNNSSPGPGGGGLLLTNASPRFVNVTVIDCLAPLRGGGAFTQAGSPSFDRCAFISNATFLGAGACVQGEGSPRFTSCTFTANGRGSTQGGGIYSEKTSGVLLVQDCEFSSDLGKFIAGNGIGMMIESGEASITGSRFINNRSVGGGGGITCAGGFTSMDRCTFIGNEARADGGAALRMEGGTLAVSNSLFSGNDREGFTSVYTFRATLTLSNCTFASNGNSTMFSPLLFASMSTISLRNCILWNNLSQGAAGQDAVQLSLGISTILFDSSLVQGWNGDLSGSNTFSADPQFANPTGPDGLAGTLDDDLHLLPGSPCIDRGSNPLAAPAPTDLDGLTRFQDDPLTADLGVGPAPVIDLGAYEFGPGCLADFDHSGFIDTDDFDAFVHTFELGDPLADVDHSGFVDTDDYDAFVHAFEQGC